MDLKGNRFDEATERSMEDKQVVNFYDKTLSNISNRYSIGQSFKKSDVKMVNNYSFVLNHLIG